MTAFHPEPLVCVSCGKTTEHAHDEDEQDDAVLVQWYQCIVCGLRRSMLPVWLDDDPDFIAALERMGMTTCSVATRARRD